MGTFKITGGKKLNGTITPQGAKNETLQILCAVLLTPEEVRITNIPDIVDVNKLIDLLGDLGVYVKKNGHGDYTFKGRKCQSRLPNIGYLQTEGRKSSRIYHDCRTTFRLDSARRISLSQEAIK